MGSNPLALNFKVNCCYPFPLCEYCTGIHEQFVDLGFVGKSDQSPTKIRRQTDISEQTQKAEVNPEHISQDIWPRGPSPQFTE
jgi:hypothetical protein